MLIGGTNVSNEWLDGWMDHSLNLGERGWLEGTGPILETITYQAVVVEVGVRGC